MTTTTNSRIGTLIRNGETMFYAFLADNFYVESRDIGDIEFYVQVEERVAEVAQ